MTKGTSDNLLSSRRRSMFVLLFIFLGSALVLFKVFYIQIIEGEKWKARYKESIKSDPEFPQRGNILSRNGEILVTSMPNYKVAIDLRTPEWKKYLEPRSHRSNTLERRLDSLCRGIKPYMPGYNSSMVKSELKRRYKEKKQFYFKEELNEVQLNTLSDLPILREGRFKSGLIAVAESKRVKPYDDMAARTLGKLGSDGKGQVGLEVAFNQELQGKAGTVVKQKLPGGYWVPMEDKYSTKPEPGYDLLSTIDVKLQDIVHYALSKQLRRYRAHHGTAVLMEVETGNVLAISNLTDTLGRYLEVYNYAVGESTEPGSTIKLASMMSLLEDGYIELTDIVDTETGNWVYATHPIRDTHGGYGKISMLDVFKVSSNVGVAKTIVQYYEKDPQKFIENLYDLTLNEPLELEIPGESTPNIKDTKSPLWWKGSIAQMSYGYELTMTPMQILAFYNAIANDGTKVQPRFAKGFSKEGQIVKNFSPRVLDRSICSNSTLKAAKILLESVVDDGTELDKKGKPKYGTLKGTAFNLKRANYGIAGKTGTAQLFQSNLNYGTEGNRAYQASFVGYFPADAPKYSCIVVITNPRGENYYGNTVAGEVFREIADYTVAADLELIKEEDSDLPFVKVPSSSNGYKPELDYLFRKLDIPVDDNDIESDWILTYNKDSVINLKERSIPGKGVIPNVLGMGLKDALFLLENQHLRVKVEGYGTVRKQSPAAGSRCQKNQHVTIYLQ